MTAYVLIDSRERIIFSFSKVRTHLPIFTMTVSTKTRRKKNTALKIAVFGQMSHSVGFINLTKWLISYSRIKVDI